MLPSAVAALKVKLEPKKHSNRNTDSDDPVPPRLCPRSPPISPHLPPSGDVLRRPTISPDYPLPTHHAPLRPSTHYASGLMLCWHNEQNIHVTFFRPPVFTGQSSVRLPPPLFHARTFPPCSLLYTSLFPTRLHAFFAIGSSVADFISPMVSPFPPLPRVDGVQRPRSPFPPPPSLLNWDPTRLVSLPTPPPATRDLDFFFPSRLFLPSSSHPHREIPAFGTSPVFLKVDPPNPRGPAPRRDQWGGCKHLPGGLTPPHTLHPR